MINRAILIGRLTADPEQRQTNTGTCVTSFSVACSERWKDKQGQQQEKTEFLNCVAFARLGEICGEYLHKGSLGYFEGKNTIDKWEDNNGNKRYSHKIVLREMTMLSPKQDTGQRPEPDERSPQPSTGEAVPF